MIPVAHLKVEFGFDVLQVARGNYAPKSYHDFIGFEVAKDALERAFHQTYSLHLTDVFGDLDLALGTYRHTVSSLIPSMTKVAWNLQEERTGEVHARPHAPQVRLQPLESQLSQGMERAV